jgi:hypothetical protein
VFTRPHRKFGAPVPDQTKPGAALPGSGTVRPNYVFSGSDPPNYEGPMTGEALPSLILAGSDALDQAQPDPLPTEWPEGARR